MRHKVSDANVQAVRDLIEKYKAITPDDFVYDSYVISERLQRLTGFGSTKECLVCKSVNAVCNICIHFVMAQSYNGNRCYTQGSYRDLANATVSDVMVCISSRIKTLEDLLERYQWDLDNNIYS